MKSVIIGLALFVCWVSCAPAADVTTAATTAASSGTTAFVKLSCTGHNPNGFFVDPKDPTIFHQCSHGLHVGTFHCQSGTIFSETDQVCVVKQVDDVNCKSPTFNGSIPFPGNAHKFIECNMGHAYIKVCPNDLIFNPTSSRCDFNDAGVTWPTDTVPTVAPTTPAATTGHGSTTGAVVASTAATACEGKGNSPDPNDKTKYFNCHLGKLLHESCPDGEIYNKDTKECE